jgi:DNA-binding MarR family transcriptional regulator
LVSAFALVSVFALVSASTACELNLEMPDIGSTCVLSLWETTLSIWCSSSQIMEGFGTPHFTDYVEISGNIGVAQRKTKCVYALVMAARKGTSSTDSGPGAGKPARARPSAGATAPVVGRSNAGARAIARGRGAVGEKTRSNSEAWAKAHSGSTGERTPSRVGVPREVARGAAVVWADAALETARGRARWLAAMRWRRALEVVLTPVGLTFTQWLVLEAIRELIDEAEDAVSQNQIAARLELDRTTISQVMRTLERKGLVDRGIDLTGRAWRVFLNDKAMRLLVGAAHAIESASSSDS